MKQTIRQITARSMTSLSLDRYRSDTDLPVQSQYQDRCILYNFVMYYKLEQHVSVLKLHSG